MKVRSGFVSNSSSSSYIIAVDEPITDAKELMKYINDMSRIAYAKRIFEKNIKHQTGVVLCEPPQPNCEECKNKFICFTGGNQDLLRYYLTYCLNTDINDEEINEADKFYGYKLRKFSIENKGKIAYVLIFPDMGEGGTMLDSEIRENAYYIIKASKICID